MSKRALTIFVAMLMALGVYSAVANAGVEGDFTFDIWMWPKATDAEAQQFEIDFEGLLDLDITLSGLTFSNDLAIGIAGLEHYIADLETTLGALDLLDEFAFARPFVNCPRRAPAKYVYINFFYFYPAFTSCKPIDELLFVKKRVTAELTLGGLTFENLIMFEDVNFPPPRADTPPSASSGMYYAGDDYYPVNPTNNSYQLTMCDGSTFTVSAAGGAWPEMPASATANCAGLAATVDKSKVWDVSADSTPPSGDAAAPYIADALEYDDYPAADQAFRFGDIITISGTTVSGINITARTGICADWDITYYPFFWGKYYIAKGLEGASNKIKKYAWWETVCNNYKLEFTKEFIAIENIVPFSGVTLDQYLLFKPDFVNGFGFEGYTQATVDLLGMGVLKVWLETPVIVGPQTKSAKAFQIESGFPVVELTLSDILVAVWEDKDADLSMTAGDYVTAIMTPSIQNVDFLNILQFKVGTGLYAMLLEADIPISFPEPTGTLEITSLWEYDADLEAMKWEKIDFELTNSMGEHSEYGIDAQFTQTALAGINLWITVSFSL